MYTYAHLLNQRIKGYDAQTNQQGNPEDHTSTLKVIPRFTSFPGSPESTTIVKAASNVQCYNPAPLVLSVNNYQLIFPGHTPNVHLIPSRNVSDQNKSIPDLPFSTTQSLGKSSHPSRAVTHLPSSPTYPVPSNPSLGKLSLHRKVKQPRHIPSSKPSYRS